MKLEVYKIKDENTGLFSTGGIEPKWTKRGKTWSQLNHVKNHLRLFCSDSEWVTNTDQRELRWQGKLVKRWINNIPSNWIVIKLSESGIQELSAKQMYPETEV